LLDQANAMAKLEGPTLKGADTVMHARTSLVLYHRDGAMVAPLEKGRPITIGRAAPADIEIADLGLSRQHARFMWDDHGIWVEDLGSTNGTKKNGEKITRAQVVPGDEIAVGPVMVAVHAMSSMDDELRGFDGHDRFVATLADEITRARTFQRPLALALLRGANKDDHISRWASRLRMRLRPVDRVGIYGPTAVLIAFPEATAETVHPVLAELASAGDPPLMFGAVTFPNDGSSVEELIAALHVAKRPDRAATAADGPVVIKSLAMKQVMTTVKRLAQSTIAVLVNGETGTGKEVIARAIHESDPRRCTHLARDRRARSRSACPGSRRS
jgi:hypothetical protein